MQVFKKEQSPVQAANASIQSAHRQVTDAAAEAGEAKVRFYKTDKWVVGTQGAKIYVAAKNTMPDPLMRSFVRSNKSDPVTDKMSYDRSKFTIDEYPDFSDPSGEGSRVSIWSHEMENNVADVEFHKDTFVVKLFNQPRTGVFPFSKDDFLKVVDVAKWQLDLFVLPRNSSDSDSG